MKVALSILAVLLVVGASVGGYYALVLAPETEAEAAPDDAAPDSASVDLGDLQAEMASLLDRLEASEAHADSLQALLVMRQEEAAVQAGDVSALATTLSKLEDERLGEVIQRLDGRSFIQLYEAASGRNQARLLASLTPQQAAAFVRVRLPGGPARVAPPDTTRSE